MNLDVKNWKPFYISDIFTIRNGKGITKEEIENNPGDLTAVQSGEENNGSIGKIDKQYCLDKNYVVSENPCLTVARSGSAGFVSFQKYGCVVGDSAKLLELKETDKISDNVLLFLQSILLMLQSKYAYGRKVTNEKYASEIIRLPVCADGSPDWGFMEEYIKSLRSAPLITKNKKNKAPDLKTANWKKFFLGRIFDIRKGKRLTAENQENGINIYIGAIDSNNGVANYISQTPIHKGNTISVNYNGSVGEAFYQPDPYWATDDVNVLYAKHHKLNRYIGLFIATVIRLEKYRFSYGRKWTLENMKASEIFLPVLHDETGTPIVDHDYKYSDNGYIPDWEFMENYIRLLPYGDRI